jgi:hypothetical protein
LQQALKEKMQAEEKLERFMKIVIERDMMCEEVDQLYMNLRE